MKSEKNRGESVKALEFALSKPDFSRTDLGKEIIFNLTGDGQL
jgi:hypothetical protein